MESKKFYIHENNYEYYKNKSLKFYSLKTANLKYLVALNYTLKQSVRYIVSHKSLVVFFRWCMKERNMTFNPLDDIEIPKLEKKLPRKLTKKDAMRILEVVDNYSYDNKFLHYRNYAIFSTFIMCGLRK